MAMTAKPKSAPDQHPLEKKSSARKTSTTPTKILTIGAMTKLSSTERHSPQMKLIFDQLFEAWKHRRRLVEIENVRRREFRELRRTLHPDLNRLEAEVDRLEAEIAELRKGLKKKKERTTPQQLDLIAAIQSLKDECSDLYPQIKSACDEVKETFFTRLDDKFAKEKKSRLESAAKRKGVPALGPNDPVRFAVIEELDAYMATLDGGEAWLRKRQIDQKAELANKVARSETGCNPGTYQAVEEAVNRAKVDAPGGDLRQKPWDRTGRIGIQLTSGKGLSVGRALSGQDEKLKIEIAEVPLRKNKSDVFYPSHSRPFDRHAKERAARAKRFASNPELRPYRKVVTVRMKLSGHVKDAVYLDIRGVLHRPLSADGVIKWAYLNVDRIGYEMFCELQLTMESETFAIQRAGVSSKEKLAINFGWRVMPDGNIRVATTWDGKKADHVVLDQSLLETQRRAERLIGHSDDHFDETRDALLTWLGDLAETDRKELFPLLRAVMPERMRKDLKSIDHLKAYIAKWRGHERLAKVANLLRDLYLEPEAAKKLLQKWRRHRLDRKEDLFTSFEAFAAWAQKDCPALNHQMALYLETWRAKDRHLVNWARHEQTKLRRHRREIYRMTAARWAQVYGQVAIEKWDKSTTAKMPKYENAALDPRQEKANAIRHFVGIYAFTTALYEKFGSDLKKESALNITVEHYGCGGTSLTPPKESPTPALKCGTCHKLYDQDINAARHLWDRSFGGGGAQQGQPQKRERSGGKPKASTARKKVTRRPDTEKPGYRGGMTV